MVEAEAPAPSVTAAALVEGASRIIRGKREFLEFLVAAILAGGHVLIEDNPGLGKTTVAKTFARLIGGGRKGLVFKRIQFTPDLLPYDITGVDVFDPKTRRFRFVPGPVLANIVLADEINRTTPKVQSALLEVMAERQVTIGAATHRPPEPFFVIATENPVESEGTFPLPAAQLDRFMMRLSLGYPSREAELSILNDNPSEKALASLEPVCGPGEFMAAREAASLVFCHPALKEAVADMVRDTRIHRGFTLGASPRAALHLLEAARALALVRGRAFITDEDLGVLAVPVLAHRLKLRDPRTQGAKLVREICLARLEGIKTPSGSGPGEKPMAEEDMEGIRGEPPPRSGPALRPGAPPSAWSSAAPPPRGSAPKTPLLPRLRLSPCGGFLFFIAAAAVFAGNLRQELALSLLGTVLLSVLAYCLILGFAAALIRRGEVPAVRIQASPRSVTAGEAAEISLSGGRRGPFPRIPGILCRCRLRLETRDGRRLDHILDPAGPFDPAKPPRARSLVFPLRGAYYSGGDELAVFDAFGIFDFSWPLPLETEARVLVSPRPAAEAPALNPRTGGREQREGPHYRRTDDLINHRPYIPGDDPRRINWKLYSHGPANSLFVREGEAEPPPRSQLLVLADTEADPALFGPRAAREGVDLLCAQMLALCLDLGGRGMDILAGYTGGSLRGGDAGELAQALAWPAALPLPGGAGDSGKGGGSGGRFPGKGGREPAGARGPLPELPVAERGTCVLALPRTTTGGGALDRFISRLAAPGAAPPCDIIFVYQEPSLREAAESCARFYGARGGIRAFAMAGAGAP